jgi:hypothetical protein
VEADRGQALRARVGEDREVEQRDDDDLQAQEHREHARVEVDLQHAEHADDRAADQAPDVPLGSDVQLVRHERAERDAEQAVDADLHRVVRDQRHEGGAYTLDLAESTRDVRVERARVGDVAAHRRVADREEAEHDPERDEEERDAAVPRDQVGRRLSARDRGQRRRRGDDEEHEVGYAERALVQLRGLCDGRRGRRRLCD